MSTPAADLASARARRPIEAGQERAGTLELTNTSASNIPVGALSHAARADRQHAVFGAALAATDNDLFFNGGNP